MTQPQSSKIPVLDNVHIPLQYVANAVQLSPQEVWDRFFEINEQIFDYKHMQCRPHGMRTSVPVAADGAPLINMAMPKFGQCLQHQIKNGSINVPAEWGNEVVRLHKAGVVRLEKKLFYGTPAPEGTISASHQNDISTALIGLDANGKPVNGLS